MTLSNPTKSPITSFIKDDVIPEIKPALPDVFMKEKKKREKSYVYKIDCVVSQDITH